MARAPKASTAVANTKANLPATSDVMAEVQAMIDGVQERIGKPGGDQIRTNNQMEFEMPDGTKSADPIHVVVIDFTNFNALYEGRYDPQNPTPPICFSLGEKLEQMVPHADALEPQSDKCSTCPMNQFGSAGNGKACKNTRKLAVVPRDALEDPENETLYTLAASPTAIKSFDKYTAALVGKRVMPFMVETEVSLDPNRDYPTMMFAAKGPLTEVEIATAFQKIPAAKARLAIGPDMAQAKAQQEAAAAAPARRGNAKAPAKTPARRGTAAR